MLAANTTSHRKMAAVACEATSLADKGARASERTNAVAEITSSN